MPNVLVLEGNYRKPTELGVKHFRTTLPLEDNATTKTVQHTTKEFAIQANAEVLKVRVVKVSFGESN